MKKFCLTISCVVFVLLSQAQLSFGPKAGLNISKISFSSTEFGSSYRPNFYLGGFANYKLDANWAAQFELFYSGEGGNEKSNMQTDATGHINESFVQIPLLAQYHTAMGFYGEAGPQVGILMAIHETFRGEKQNIKKYYKATDFRFPVGIGYEFPSTSSLSGLGVNARYSFSLSKINKETVGGEHLKNSVFSIGAFYRLPMAGKH